MARETTMGTDTKFPTSMAELRGILGLDFDHADSSSLCFVLDERLELAEAPVIDPIVHPLATSGFPYSFEVFHHYLAPVEPGDDVLTNVVVNPSHKPSFSARRLPKKFPTSTSAFSLKFATQVSKSTFRLLDFGRSIKPAVARDGKVVHSEVDAENWLRCVVLGFDFFGECKQEETPAPLIYLKKTLLDFPTEVFLIAIRDSEWYLNSTFDSIDTEDIAFE